MHQRLQIIQDSLSKVFFSGRLIGMAENVPQQPDIVKTTRLAFCAADEPGQRFCVFMQVRQDQMPSVQSARLSSAMAMLRSSTSFRKAEKTLSSTNSRAAGAIAATALSRTSRVTV